MFLLIILLCVGMLIMPYFFHVKPFIVKSGSMEPIIETGSVAWINENDTDVKVDDIVAYQLSESESVTHRVIDIRDGFYITKGDANETEDLKPVEPSQIIGKYAFSIPELGYMISDFQSNKLKAISVSCIFFAIMLISSLLDSTIKEYSDNKKKKRISA